MVTTIRAVVKFDSEPSQTFLDSYSDNLIRAVDIYVNHKPRSYHIEAPSNEQIDRRDYIYKWIIDVVDVKCYAQELFRRLLLTPGGDLILVGVLDHQFDPAHKSNVGYYWTNEGEIWYHDSERLYVDPVYEFHANGTQDYEIIHIPTYIDRRDGRNKEYYLKSGATFMWGCVSSWDNFMKATTLPEAIEEFEQMYKKMLWESVEGHKKSLDKAIESFSNFDEYRWNKKW